MKRQLLHRYEDIISPENLLGAWREFVRGKRHKPDVQTFAFHLMDNILALHRDLQTQTYRHGPYQHFRINDPKPRDIHKATVRDRLVHHATHRVLYWFYHQIFIADSFSCRLGKGTHRALNRFRALAYRASQNHTSTVWVLRGDIKKFFASIDHEILLSILRERITDEKIVWLLIEIVSSFHSTRPGVGLPLGNLTSQLLVNLYLNEFDQFVKHRLKVKHYLRYADDFVLLSPDRGQLIESLSYMGVFLHEQLRLVLHPDKVSLKTLASGVDYLGWVHFPDHRVLRTATRWRMLKNIKQQEGRERERSVASYLGLIGHGNTYKLRSLIQ